VPFLLFGVASAGGAVFGFFFVRNPDVQARKSQVLHDGIYDDVLNQ
jgi:hypothetical protein